MSAPSSPSDISRPGSGSSDREVQDALTRTAFYITNPALLFTVVAGSDIRAALGTDAPLALLSAAAVGALYSLLSCLFFRRPVAETAVGAMASSHGNANIGIPVSLYAVGRGAAHCPGCLPLCLTYRRGVIVARDIILCTTLLCSGSLLMIAWLLS